MKAKMFLMFVCLLTLSTVGCVGQQAFTKMARSGDTVTLALGGSPSHEINGHVNKNNMVVTITDSANNTYDVTLRYLLKLYPDPSSRYNYHATYDTSIVPPYLSREYIDPNQGEWVAVVDLTDPGTGTPLPLAQGAAKIHVMTPDLVDSRPYRNFPATDGNLANIPIEILPNTGSPHPFNNWYGDPIDLEPLPQMVISFDNSAITLPYPDNITKIGAIEFKLMYNMAYFNNNAYPPMILAYINEQRISVSYRLNAIEGYYKLMILPQNVGAGILANNAGVDYLKTKIKDIKVVVAWDPSFLNNSITAENYEQVFQISDYKVVDNNGLPLNDGSGNPLITLVKEPRID